MRIARVMALVAVALAGLPAPAAAQSGPEPRVYLTTVPDRAPHAASSPVILADRFWPVLSHVKT